MLSISLVTILLPRIFLGWKKKEQKMDWPAQEVWEVRTRILNCVQDQLCGGSAYDVHLVFDALRLAESEVMAILTDIAITRKEKTKGQE